MQVIIAGSGQLATELLARLTLPPGFRLVAWSDPSMATERSIVVHAGSGRELEALAAYCMSTRSPMLELATGSTIESVLRAFPVVVCPNTNILMLKVMAMLEHSGSMFQGYGITLTESHQASKTSVPGTAVAMAQSLGLRDTDILSVRDAQRQRQQLQIPEADLARHAYHQVRVQDGACSLTLETRVSGDAPYAQGVARIIEAAAVRELDDRIYSVMDFIRQGWL